MVAEWSGETRQGGVFVCRHASPARARPIVLMDVFRVLT